MFKRFLLVLTLILLPLAARADVSFIGGGGGGGGGGGAPTVTGQAVVNGSGVVRADASMIAGPVGLGLGGASSIAAPSFTTDVPNAVVLNIYSTDGPVLTPPAADTLLLNLPEQTGVSMGIWAGYQTLASAGASGAQTFSITGSLGLAAVTIPLMPVSGQTIGLSTAATRLQSCASANQPTCTVTVPSGTVAGDTLLACDAWFPSSSNNLPTGQPVPATGTQRWASDGVWYLAGNNNNAGIQCFRKTSLGAGEPASYTLGGATGGSAAAFIADLTNVQSLDVPMTSATGTFTAGNVGNDLCLQGADTSFFYQSVGAAGGQGCGQIGGFGSATKIYPNFGNLSGSTISGKQYVYGPDQGAAIQAAIPSAGVGGHAILGTGIYMTCGGNNTGTCLTFPNGPTILEGQGRGTSNGYYTGQTTNDNPNLGTYVVVANTDLSQTAWAWTPTTAQNAMYSLTIRDLNLWGGVGTARDGGGAAGFTATNYSFLNWERAGIGNFLGDDLDTVVTTGQYSAATTFDRIWLTGSSADGWKDTITGTGLAQNETVRDSDIEENVNNGIELTGSHYTFNVSGSILQRNDAKNQGGSRYEIYCNSCTAYGDVFGNYFENDSGIQNAQLSNQAAGWASVFWNANFGIGFVASPNSFYPASSGLSLPQHFLDTTAGSGKTYTVPVGATSVLACVAGGGGGGGAATSGGAAALSGGSGGSGNYYCAKIFGTALTQAITYTVGAAGTAGTCSAAPTAAGVGGTSSISVNGVGLANALGGGLGGTASTTVEGTAGPAPTAFTVASFHGGIVSSTVAVDSYTSGSAGNAGTGDNYVAQGYGGGGNGGLPYGVTSGGACDATIVATPGSTGFAEFTANFN